MREHGLNEASLTDLESLGYWEELYRGWQQDPASVQPGWAAAFRGFEQTGALEAAPTARRAAPGAGSQPDDRQCAVDRLLAAYREVGYFYARLNPLLPAHEPNQNYLYPRARGAYQRLDLEAFGLSPADLDTEFSAGPAMRPARAPLREILQAFQETYCGSFGVEFLHIQNRPIRTWLAAAMEGCRNRAALNAGARRRILEDLIRAEEFEQFLHKTFIGQKRFSLEGAEVTVPALRYLVQAAVGSGVGEIVLGTAHRGRITILNQILDMPAEEVFTLFEDRHDPGQYGGSGDVKYHLGYTTERADAGGASVRITLVSNPSHLESVDAVVEGKARARQEAGGFWQGTKRVLPVIVHGDAAFCGQGVVAEIFNLAQVEGYHTGGTIHVIINNQIGFTTSSRDSRSTFFPTDVAKTASAPVFHVNGDDPEAVVYAMDLALRFRQKFSQDVVVDIVCYRRHGHNEGDEPSFTNPRMYRVIRGHPSVCLQYGQAAAAAGVMPQEEQDRLRQAYAAGLRQALKTARENPPAPKLRSQQGEEWNALMRRYSHEPVATGVEPSALRRIADALTTVPEGFQAHPKLRRILQEKRDKLSREGAVDWALAEALAFGSLLLEGTPVRLSGQDCGRGTFSQRHAIWWDTESPETISGPVAHVPLNHLALEGRQALIQIHDSPLSEYSILGFEYGYSLHSPHALVLWEAQFGDFCNGAQVVIDNFIAAAEAKWGRASGLVLLLPHGYEGQGPEHSSAHLERFLQLGAEDNLEVCNATTPAQYFHLLRRQVRRDFRRPLVLMSPKSLLRHPAAVSPLEELSRGRFEELLAPEPGAADRGVSRVLLCSGKVYYDLVEGRGEREGGRTAILRLEQLYPFPVQSLRRALRTYPEAGVRVWVQEEPENRGGLRHVREQLARHFGDLDFQFVSRPASASPAVGSHRAHQEEQRLIVEQAYAAGPPRKQKTKATGMV